MHQAVRLLHVTVSRILFPNLLPTYLNTTHAITQSVQQRLPHSVLALLIPLVQRS